MLRPRRRTLLASTASGFVTAALVFTLVAGANVALGSPAQAATPASSAVTVTAAEQDRDLTHAPMPDLAVTVSQTENLVAQGVRVSWTGGKKSVVSSVSSGGENFLQIFMCWGDDPTDSSRPDRTTCQYGAPGNIGASRDAYRASGTALADVPKEDQAYTAPGLASFLPPYTAIPFVARDGKRVDAIKTDPTTGAKSRDLTVDLSTNEFFTSYTTNEIPWAGSGDDGSGSVSFEVQTLAQSNGLGCGTPVVHDGVTTGASCWLVVLPRGTADNGASSISQSGLFIDSWRHALSIKLDFEPVGSRCEAGAKEHQLAGSELISYAAGSWQPAVCKQASGGVYSLLTVPESDAVTAAATTDDAPLALTSFPLAADGGSDPLVYAPLAISGISVALAIDRSPDPFLQDIPEKYLAAAHLPFTSVNLTPRLLAKLLSYSYLSSLPTGADTSYMGAKNPSNITKDPDFLAVNDPEWAAQDLAGPAIADVIVPQGRSDAARAVWAYIAADDDARAFLAGEPDPWGMTVNPWYATDAAKNKTGNAFSLDRDDFPKADPVEYAPTNSGPVNLVTWRPYASDLGTVSYLTLRGDGQILGGWDPYASPPRYAKASRMATGSQAMLGLTSSAAAARYQVISASLRNPAGSFVAATGDAMAAAAAAMTADNAAGAVVGFQPASPEAKAATSAYPLTLPIYAANNPAKTTAAVRTSYAAFIRYAVSTNGQTPGADEGQLPAGYAPLPSSWVAQATAAAERLETYAPATTTAPPTTPAAAAPGRPAAATAAAAPVAAPAAAAPTATGAASGALAGATTPGDPDVGALAAAVPATVLGGAAGALVVPLITRFRRRVL